MGQILKCNFQEKQIGVIYHCLHHKLQAVLFQTILFHIHNIVIVGTDGVVL